ncbi:MAG TPA: signal peptidase I [Candidatus Binatia bacterium]|nr:signal peptidase I [Candidatus Binatia bacterium]
MAELNLPVQPPTKTNNAQCGEKRETASPAQISNVVPFIADHPNPARRALKRQLIVIALLLISSVISYYLINRWCLSTVVVQGRSMMPTLEDGDRCLLNRLSYLYTTPKRGDLVVLRDRGESDLAVKRIVALPGENVRVTHGIILVNGHRLPEPYLESGTMTILPSGGDETYQLRDTEYFVLGDNRAESEDSRYYGPIARNKLVGTLIK